MHPPLGLFEGLLEPPPLTQGLPETKTDTQARTGPEIKLLWFFSAHRPQMGGGRRQLINQQGSSTDLAPVHSGSWGIFGVSKLTCVGEAGLVVSPGHYCT